MEGSALYVITELLATFHWLPPDSCLDVYPEIWFFCQLLCWCVLLFEYRSVPKWPTYMIGSCDTFGSQGLLNYDRECIESADSEQKSSGSLRSRWLLGLFYRGLPLTVNNIWANLGIPAHSSEPKATLYLATSFVRTLLMDGQRGWSQFQLVYKQLFKSC